MRKRKGLENAIRKSPINYFSDLFIVAMVLAWVSVLLTMVIFAIYSTIILADTTVWGEVGTLVAVPLSCGGAIWMVKNSVQHAIAANRGDKVVMDFPKVNADGEEDGNEKEGLTESEVQG